jgi:ElaB/YqjD/DUF883 family membrane-anchored ribosome-binding protein
MKYGAKKVRSDAFFNDLVESVDDLLKRISDIDSPDFDKIRSKVQIALSAAKSAWQETAHYANEQVTNSLRWPGERMRESPWRTVGIAAVVGIGLGALLTRSRSR